MDLRHEDEKKGWCYTYNIMEYIQEYTFLAKYLYITYLLPLFKESNHFCTPEGKQVFIYQ